MNDFTNMQDITDQFDSEDIKQNQAMGILSYLGFLVLIPIFAARQSKFAMFHANQGIVLAAIEVALGIVVSFLIWVPIIGTIIGLVYSIICLVCLVFSILGIVNAAGGKAKKLPLLGQFSFIK